MRGPQPVKVGRKDWAEFRSWACTVGMAGSESVRFGMITMIGSSLLLGFCPSYARGADLFRAARSRSGRNIHPRPRVGRAWWRSRNPLLPAA